MNDKFKQLALQAKMGTADFDAGSYYVATPAMMQQFCELIVQECAGLNKQQSYELMGVIADVENDNAFDDVCLTSVKQVEQYLKGKDLLKHFGVEQ
jgi:hypothetical protein